MTSGTVWRNGQPHYSTPIRREGNSWFIPSVTDPNEEEHRVDLLAGQLFCSCTGYVNHKKCQHVDRVRRTMEHNGEAATALVPANDHGSLPAVYSNPQDLRARLDDMRQETGLVQQFMRDIMVKSRDGEADGDYGIIPGTDKPTLFKAGAEKLCELYGYAPTIANVDELPDYNTGHLRVVARVALVQKGTGVKIAEGVGECSTRESRYAYRWVFENDVPAGLDKAKLKSREFRRKNGQGTFRKYRLDNEDLFDVWNTVLKMAKKRALVDATLSATRSSGIFTQSAEHLDEWIEAEYTDITDEASAAPVPAPATDATKKALAASWKKLTEAFGDDKDGLNAYRGRLAGKYPSVFVEDRNAFSAATEDEGQQLLKEFEAAIAWLNQPADPAFPCEQHEPSWSDEKAALICGKCGEILPDPPHESEGAPQETAQGGLV